MSFCICITNEMRKSQLTAIQLIKRVQNDAQDDVVCNSK